MTSVMIMGQTSLSYIVEDICYKLHVQTERVDKFSEQLKEVSWLEKSQKILPNLVSAGRATQHDRVQANQDMPDVC